VTVRAATYMYVLWHTVASALLAGIICSFIRLAAPAGSTQPANHTLFWQHPNNIPDYWFQSAMFSTITLMLAFPILAQNLCHQIRNLIKRMYHGCIVSIMIVYTICMLCSSHLIVWTQFLTKPAAKLLHFLLPDRIRRSWFRPTRDARRAR
jgi:hypothetical protein